MRGPAAGGLGSHRQSGLGLGHAGRALVSGRLPAPSLGSFPASRKPRFRAAHRAGNARLDPSGFNPLPKVKGGVKDNRNSIDTLDGLLIAGGKSKELLGAAAQPPPDGVPDPCTAAPCIKGPDVGASLLSTIAPAKGMLSRRLSRRLRSEPGRMLDQHLPG